MQGLHNIWRLFVGAIAAFSLIGGTVLAADIDDSLTAEEISTILEEAGFTVSMSADKDNGNPVAKATIGRIVFVVRALDCSGKPKSCSQLMLFANFDLNRDVTDEDYRIVNDFNDSSVDGRAYVLGRTNQIGIDFMIDLTGGVSSAHVSSRLSRWERIIDDFIGELRAAQTKS